MAIVCLGSKSDIFICIISFSFHKYFNVIFFKKCSYYLEISYTFYLNLPCLLLSSCSSLQPLSRPAPCRHDCFHFKPAELTLFCLNACGSTVFLGPRHYQTEIRRGVWFGFVDRFALEIQTAFISVMYPDLLCFTLVASSRLTCLPFSY